MALAPPASLNQFEDWAEDMFQTIGTGTDVVVNPPRRDRRGWDFMAEWEAPAVPGLPRDRQKTARTARIQVKSCRQSKPVARLKLSNALRFAEAVDPCFVVVYWLDKKRNEVQIFARHFDEELVERALRRAREADRDGEADLHKIALIVPMADRDLHTDDLIRWLKDQCRDAPAAYTHRKALHHETVGYDGPGLVGKLTFDPHDVHALIERALGLPTPFDPAWIELREQRFGIPASTPLVAGVPLHFELKAKPKDASVIFRSPDGRHAKFDGEMRSFHVGLVRDRDVLTAAFTSPSVTGRLYADSRFELNYNLSGSTVYDARHLEQLLTLFTMLADGGVTATLVLEGKRLDSATITDRAPALEIGFYRWAREMLRTLLKNVKRAEKPQLSLAQLIDAAESVEIFAACVLDGATTMRMRLVDASPPAPQISGLLGYAHVEVGSHTYAAFLRKPPLSQHIEGDLLTAEFGDPQVLDAWARPGSLEAARPAIRRRFAQLRRKAPAFTIYACEGDMIAAATGQVDISVTRVGDDPPLMGD